MKRIFFSTIFVLTAAALLAQDWARQHVDKSPRHREWVTVKNGARSVQTFVAYPESNQKTPVVVVIHDIAGHSDWAEDITDQIASLGYIAIAPDLLSGMGPNGGNTKSFAAGGAGQGINSLPPDQITADLNAVSDYGLKLPASNGKIFVTGFCWGGGQTWRFATNRKGLTASLPFYGPSPDLATVPNISAPVYAFYAENDMRINATIPDLEKAMQAAGKKYDKVIYVGAGHGFMKSGQSPTAKEADNKASVDSFARLKQVLASLK